MIKENYEYYRTRDCIERYQKLKSGSGSHLTNMKKEVEFEYYVCDYCKQKIQLKRKLYEQTGGIVVIPATVTKRKAIKLALCNSCLNKVLAEFEEKR